MVERMKNLLFPSFGKFLLVVSSFLAQDVYGQYIKLDNKLVFSSFYNSEKLPILSSERVPSYSFLLGSDYLQKDWFYLSSQLGYMKIGGKETNPLLQGDYANVSESKSYVHLNTTFRAYVRLSDLKLFVGAGPYINILAGNKKFNSSLYNADYNFKNMYVGGKAEVGITREVNKFRIGVIGDYLHNLSASAASQYIKLNNNIFSATLTVGYIVR